MSKGIIESVRCLAKCFAKPRFPTARKAVVSSSCSRFARSALVASCHSTYRFRFCDAIREIPWSELLPSHISNSVRQSRSARGATVPRKMTWDAAPQRKARCEICKGFFGLIRYRFAHKQFCSQQCLDRYTAEREQSLFGLEKRKDLSPTH